MRTDAMKEWLECQPIGGIINDTFLPIKTPIKENIPLPPHEVFTPSMFVHAAQNQGINLGLVINLCYTDKYYDPEEFRYYGIEVEKIYCKGHSGPPSLDNCELFVKICRNFIESHPNLTIAVHCTHGHNRTGYMICYFLCKIRGWSVEDAISEFERLRFPGIKKLDYKESLHSRFNPKAKRVEEPEGKLTRQYQRSQKTNRADEDSWWRAGSSYGNN